MPECLDLVRTSQDPVTFFKPPQAAAGHCMETTSFLGSVRSAQSADYFLGAHKIPGKLQFKLRRQKKKSAWRLYGDLAPCRYHLLHLSWWQMTACTVTLYPPGLCSLPCTSYLLFHAKISYLLFHAELVALCSTPTLER